MIKWLKGKYFFLDNNFEMDIPYQGIVYPSVTHAYCASQAITPALKQRISRSPLQDLKRLAALFEDDPAPREKGPNVMRELLETKFGYNRQGVPGENMLIMKKLLETTGSKIQYGNYDHSQFWGFCHCPDHEDGTNLNVLGGLLEGVRRRWNQYILQSNEENTHCRCKHPATDYFLYTIGFNPYLMPHCNACQADAMQEAYNLCGDKLVTSFLREPEIDEQGKVIIRRRASGVPYPQVRELQLEMVDDWDERLTTRVTPIGPHRHHVHHPDAMMSMWGRGGSRTAYNKPSEDPRQWKGRVIKC